MYVISDNIRNKFYSGGLQYTPLLYIGETQVLPEKIKSISLDDPFYDKTSETMHIGTFISKKLEIEFKGNTNIDLTEPITFSIQVYDEEENETVTIPIGIFHIETSPKDFYNEFKLTALDNAVLMKTAIDITPFMSVATGDTQPSITAENLLIALCNYYNITLGTYPNVNRNVKTYFYDNTYSGKRYISYIAEIMGGNAVISRTGELNIIPLKNRALDQQGNQISINATTGKAFAVNEEQYQISKVIFDNGVVIPSQFGTDTHNTLFIRTDNLFIGGTDQERDNIVENIYNAVKDYAITVSVEAENYVDLSLDSTDIVNFYTMKNGILLDEYEAPYSINWKWQGSIMGKVNSIMPSKQQQVTTNVLDNEDTRIRKIQTEIDQQNGTITTLANDVTALEEIVEVFRADLDTNTVLVTADANNYPLSTKNYDVTFTANYLGTPVTVTPTTTDTHTGITVDITSSRIRFSVSSATAITYADNKYTFEFSYTDSNSQTYTITRSIMVSLINQEEAIIYSDTAPTEHNALWYDTVNNQLKRYTEDGWIIVNDFSAEISSISTNLSNMNTNLQNQINTTNANITRTRSDLELAVTQSATALQLNFSEQINATNSNLGVTTTTVDEIKSYINFEDGNIILGKVGNQYKLRITNDGILIYYNDKLISNWQTDQFTITQINMGNFSFIPRDNGSLSFRKER